ncbi:hypothetical protein SKAU_G00356540 [Synaphobranchus kaupii]|uniref:Uncharacterized protein n=1 Tax=Synaphobranchus kaupii TaxID=118154 RepID=A0A9Q1EHG5_SYNKA|nr:hypothetical protein SKAU_G00356540 [Synaphobranchus kaupii]
MGIVHCVAQLAASSASSASSIWPVWPSTAFVCVRDGNVSDRAHAARNPVKHWAVIDADNVRWCGHKKHGGRTRGQEPAASVRPTSAAQNINDS